MKKKFSKILGVGLTLALLVSLLLTAAPVMAATAITDLTVSVAPTTISKGANFTITFDATNEVTKTADGSPYDIIIALPLGVTVPATWGASDISVQSTAGFGVKNDVADLPANNIVTTAATSTAGPIVNLDLGDVSGFVNIGEAAMVRVKFKNLVLTNPSTLGTFTLTVKTSADTTAVAATYTTTAPTIAPLPGVVELRNPSGIFMGNWTGDNAIETAITNAGVDYVINVGEGTYACDLTIPVTTHTGLELVTVEGAVIKGVSLGTGASEPAALRILATGVKVHGFTIESPDGVVAGADTIYGIEVANEDVEIYDNAFVSTCAGTGTMTMLVTNTISWDTNEVSGLSIHDNTFTSDTVATVWSEGVYINWNPNHSDPDSTTAASLIVTIADNEFGGNILRGIITERSKTTISGNTIVSAWALTGIFPAQALDGITVFSTAGNPNPGQDNVVVTGNTVIGFEDGITLGHATATNNVLTAVSISGNTLEGNKTGVKVQAKANAAGISVNFNDIIDSVTYGVDNDDPGTLDATFNWWGTAVATEVAAEASGLVTYTPFVTGTTATVLSASKVATVAASLDAKTTVGVKVSVTTAAGVATNAAVISASKYIDNPQEAIADAIAFYDVYVVGTGAPTTDVATIKFYAGDANTEVYLWSADTETWVEVTPVSFSTYGGYVYVTVDVDMLDGTPFALVGAPAVAVLDTAIVTPKVGAEDVSLRPTLVWAKVDAADAYDVWLANNPDFTTAVTERVTTTFWAIPEDLQYDTTYWWRVRGITLLPLVSGEWSASVFITMAEPVEPTPPVVVEEAPPAPDIIIEQPDVIVTVPAATPITPSWIYVIIGVGAVLVIALLVLIVRTRRVA